MEKWPLKWGERFLADKVMKYTSNGVYKLLQWRQSWLWISVQSKSGTEGWMFVCLVPVVQVRPVVTLMLSPDRNLSHCYCCWYCYCCL